MILITGANGLLGSYLANELLKQGHEVLAFVRKDSDLSLLEENHQNLKIVTGDVLDIMSLQKAFEEHPVNKVVHAAAVVSFHPRDYDRMYKVNVEGTRNVVNVALQNPIDKFLHISSVAALGRSASGLIDEKTPWNSTGYNSKYGISKKDAEIEVWRGQVEGLNAVILNPSLVLAPADGQRSSSRFFSYLEKQKKFYPTGTLNYIDIRDAVKIIIEFVNNEVTNDRFIVSAGSVSYKEFFRKAAELRGLKAPGIPVKKITGSLALFADKIRSRIWKVKPHLSAESLRVSRSNVRFDNSKIKSIINIEFQPLEETIKWVWRELKVKDKVEI